MKRTSFSVILAAGGVGSRMQSAVPKQYLSLKNKPIALYSFELFLRMPEVERIIVVCDPNYRNIFDVKSKKVIFASPGERRQDSVLNGIQLLNGNPLVCIHDAARPLIKTALIHEVVEAANQWQAAAVAVPVKGTIKICNSEQLVSHTPDRSFLWEMQTPQVIRLELLKEGYNRAAAEKKQVTDDVSLIELLGNPVKIVKGCYSNIKVTTPEDLLLAEQLMSVHACL